MAGEMTDAEAAAVLRRWAFIDDVTDGVDDVAIPSWQAAIERAIEVLEREAEYGKRLTDLTEA